MKQPFYFRMRDKSVFLFVGIWDVWKKGDEEIISCVIITTEPNDLLAPVYNRMPVILNSKDYDVWLEADADANEAINLLRPSPAEYMNGYPVSSSVNNPGIDALKFVEPI